MPTSNRYEPLLLSLRQRASAQPARLSRRIFIRGQACGWAEPDVVRALQAHALVVVNPKGLTLPADDISLADIADHLRTTGVLSGWRNELLDIPGPDGQPLAHIERAAMRPLGLATRAVHLNAYTRDKRMWIAQRALTKNTDPGKWDTLVGGLVAAGESLQEALWRESYEEAGLLPEQMQDAVAAGEFLVSRNVPEGFQVEAVIVTDCVLEDDCQPNNQDGEVAAIKTADIDEILDMIEADQFTIEAALSILSSLHQSAH